MKRILVLSGILLFAASCVAQKNELNFGLGNTWSYNSNATVSGVASVPFASSSGQASHLTYEVGAARQLASFKPFSLGLELTAAGFPTDLKGNFSSVFVVPAAKFTFLPRSPISPFATTGVGFVHFAKGGLPSSNAAAFGFGGGADVKTPIRFLSFRAEVRDFHASQAGFAFVEPFPGSTTTGTRVNGSSRNHLLTGGGFVFRF